MSTRPKPGITVAIVEDSASVRASLTEILRGIDGIQCLAACATGEDALEHLPPLRPQVVLMDINLPGIDGVECVRRLVEKLPGVLVVMLTVHDDDTTIIQSLSAGACGYLHKPVRSDALVEALREVCAGGSPMTGSIARKVVQLFSKPRPGAPPAPLEGDLTQREAEVLGYLSQGYAYKEIADVLEVSYHTIHTHIRHIYEKLHVRSRGEAVAKYLGR